MAKILIVEDEWLIARFVQKTLEQLGYEVIGIVDTGEAAISLTQVQTPSLILMDIKLKGNLDGIETATQINAKNKIPVIFLTAYSDERILERAKISEAFGYLLKPFNERTLQITIEMALYKHQMEARLRESEERYRTLFESSREGIVATRPDGSILEFNSAFAQILGFTPEEFRETYKQTPRQGKMDLDFFKQLVELQCTTEFEKDFTRKDGTNFTAALKPWKLYDFKGDLLGAWFIVKDISKQKFIEIEKDRLMDYALETTRIKERIKQKISNEFIGPLTVVRDWIEKKMSEFDHESNKEKMTIFVEKGNILDSIKSLISSIETIIQSQRIQEGHIHPDFRRIDVYVILEEALLAVKQYATEKGVDIRLTGIHREIQAEPYQLKQAFIQVLSNAVKFSPNKSVVEVLIALNEGRSSNEIQIRIADQGFGFTAQELAMVFQEFGSVYAEQEQKLSVRGAGFGLFICRQIIEMHEGEIEIESAGANQGTSVTITIPSKSNL